MRFQDFWSLVEKHPWIPRILFLLWESLEHDPISPHAIADCLSPKALRGVEIDLFDWENLNLNEIRSDSSDNSERNQLGIGIYHSTYWHRLETTDLPFTRRTSNQDPGLEKLTVQQLLQIVMDSGGVVDAVVKMTLIIDFKRPKNMIEAIREIIGGEDLPDIHLYAIYMPPF